MSAPDIVYACLNDLQTRVQSIAQPLGITNVQLCLSMADLQQVISGSAGYTVGVMYAGQASYVLHKTGLPKVSHDVGLSSLLRASVILLVSSKKVLGTDQKPQALGMLQAIRDSIKDSLGPSNHFWKFISELPAGEQGSLVAWQQNWQIPINIT